MRTYLVAVSCILLLAPVLSAQYAEALSSVADSDEVTPEQALWLAGSSAGSLEPGTAIDDAAERLSELDLPTAFLVEEARSARGGVSVAEFSLLMMRVEEIPSGFWFGVAPSPFTAYRHLQRVGVIRRGTPPSERLSGARAIDLTRRYLEFAGRVVPDPRDRQ